MGRCCIRVVSETHCLHHVIAMVGIIISGTAGEAPAPFFEPGRNCARNRYMHIAATWLHGDAGICVRHMRVKCS